ncbi:MAG: glycosyltransferase [Phycisphaerales bacterium]|nr:glycosyltransferase [Phycisphaerales bacterium]
MLLLLACGAWAGTVAVLLWRAVRQYGFYEVLGPDALLEQTPRVAVVIPARNEAHNLPRCLKGLLAQDYPADRWQITVVDDGSTDGTADVVQQFAQSDPRVRLLEGAVLPPGWAGKTHALWQGAAEAPSDADWLCFIDADTAPQPPLLRTAVRAAQGRGLGFLSLGPCQELLGFWERLLMPTGFFLLAFTQDVRQANDPASPQAHANGQFLLIHKEAYEAAGTYAAVRSQIADDSAMARAVKHSGHRIAVLGSQGLISARMYSDLGSLWEGLCRQAGELLGGTWPILLAAACALALGVAAVSLPFWAALSLAHGPNGIAPITALVLASLGSAALLGTHIGAARYFQIPIGYGLLFPAGYLMGAVLLLNAAYGRVTHSVTWKGREYPGGRTSRVIVPDAGEKEARSRRGPAAQGRPARG